MGNKRVKFIGLGVLIVVVIGVVVGFTVGHKTTAEKLQSQQWTLTNEEESNTAKFEKDGTMIVGKEPLTVNYKYSVQKQGNVEYLKLTHHEDLGSDSIYYFKIKKTDSGYSLTLDKGKTNQPAKNEMDVMKTKNNLVEN